MYNMVSSNGAHFCQCFVVIYQIRFTVRQGQWWNERPQISQEYEKGSGLNGQRELDGSNEPPKSVNDDLSIISSLRRRKPPSANFQHHVTGGTPAPKSSSQQTIIPKPDPGTTSTKVSYSIEVRWLPPLERSVVPNTSAHVQHLPAVTEKYSLDRVI